jgi:ubiquinone/menaquinone biosynthesis C-methylase UbiE
MKMASAKANKNIEYVVMDATQMTFAEGEFDVVIDKGTLDALACGSDYEVTNKMLREMVRVLKAQG